MDTNPIIVLPAEDLELLMPILHDALPIEERLRRLLSTPTVTSYAGWIRDELVGAVAVRWDATSEIEVLAVAAPHRGRGYGTAIVSAVLDEARRRSVARVVVGTASFSLDNILFYQKCGFRMSHVRRDFFADLKPPMVWRGVFLRDMIVFDYVLRDDA